MKCGVIEIYRHKFHNSSRVVKLVGFHRHFPAFYTGLLVFNPFGILHLAKWELLTNRDVKDRNAEQLPISTCVQLKALLGSGLGDEIMSKN